MEIIIGLLVLSAAALWYYNRDKGLDVNKDSKVDVNDVKAAVENAVAGVKEDVKEIETVVENTVVAVKTEAAEIKSKVKKAAAKTKTKQEEPSVVETPTEEKETKPKRTRKSAESAEEVLPIQEAPKKRGRTPKVKTS